MNEPSPSFTIGVVAHEKRLEQAKRLYDNVGASVISIDERPYIGCEANHRRTWQALTTHTTDWLIVLEDDAQPVPGFRHQLTQALTVAPTPIVSLYLGRQHPENWQETINHNTQQADATDAHWITADSALHAVGIALHTELLTAYLEFTRHRAGWWPTDQTLSRWARDNHHPIAYTWPSLVEHLDQPTVIRQRHDGTPRPPGRTAWRTGTHTTWTTNTVHMKLLPPKQRVS